MRYSLSSGNLGIKFVSYFLEHQQFLKYKVKSKTTRKTSQLPSNIDDVSAPRVPSTVKRPLKRVSAPQNSVPSSPMPSGYRGASGPRVPFHVARVVCPIGSVGALIPTRWARTVHVLGQLWKRKNVRQFQLNARVSGQIGASARRWRVRRTWLQRASNHVPMALKRNRRPAHALCRMKKLQPRRIQFLARLTYVFIKKF